MTRIAYTINDIVATKHRCQVARLDLFKDPRYVGQLSSSLSYALQPSKKSNRTALKGSILVLLNSLREGTNLRGDGFEEMIR